MGKWVKVAKVEEVPEGQTKRVEAEGRDPIALFRVGGVFYALDNACTHAGGPLAEGVVNEGQVECPWHGARFKLASGEALTPPASEGVVAYQVRVNGSDIEVEFA